jgi:hypothetical protein
LEYLKGQTAGIPVMTWFFAFLHHVAAFTLVAALVIEFVLIRDDLSDSDDHSLGVSRNHLPDSLRGAYGKRNRGFRLTTPTP